jgi:hypothetical protein
MITLGWVNTVAGKAFTDKEGNLHRVTAQTSNQGCHGVYVDGKHHARAERDQPRGELKRVFDEVVAKFVADGWVETQTPKRFTVDYGHCQAPSSTREMDEEELAYHMDLDMEGGAYDNNIITAGYRGERGRPTTFSEWAEQAEVSDAFKANAGNGFRYWFKRRE